jgi:demethylspheroidene O-methyltransferase
MNWLDRLRTRRDALLGSARFRHWAATFPLTRFIARRRASALFDLCAGFVYSQTLLACQRLRLFDILAEGPLEPEALAQRLGLAREAADRLMAAAEALSLVARRSGGRWGLGSLGAPMVENEALAAMIEHNALLYEDLTDPVELLRGNVSGRLRGYWAYARRESPAGIGAAAVADYSELMARSVSLVAQEVVDRYPLGEHRVLLDVGGGEGAFLEAVARRVPALGLMLFDLPPVAARAARRLAAAQLGARVRVHGGDFHRDRLPEGADLITLVRVLHDHDDPEVLDLLGTCRAALPPGGRLLIAEPMAGVAGASTAGPVYFGFYLLAMGSGRARTPAEYGSLLRAAGFDRISRLASRLPVQAGLLVAERVS